MQDNLILKAKKTFALSKPAFILLMISALLTSILAIVTVKNIDRSQKLMELSFLRQGTTMIHAFEAGTRTSMLYRKSTGRNPLVSFATEVLEDKGVAYIRIIDEDDAVVVSQGNVAQSSKKNYSEFKKIGSTPVFSISWPDNIFEVSSIFKPFITPYGMSMMERHWEQWNLTFKPKGQMYITIGFYTNEYQQTRKEDMYHTIFMLVMLLLLFFAGLYFLFLYQKMHVTHLTLLNTQLYTNNVLESIPDSLLTLDQEKHVVSCNRNAEKLLGLPSTEIIGKEILSIFPTCPHETLTSQNNIIEKDAELTGPNDKPVPIKMGSAQLMDHQGIMIGKVLVMRDVGEIRLMEQQLEHSRRLAALGSMAAGIAHEVRNPLGTLRGLAHFFGSEDGASDACKEYSKFMISEVDRLNQLVTELLQFGAPQDIKFDKVDIKTMVKKIVALLEQDFVKNNINFTFQYDENIELYGDTDLLIQTLLNLLKNSIQASPTGSEISLNIGCDGKTCRLAVSDSGTGMSEETKSKMFDPFYTTKKSGTGLGLAVSHRIVERHNGYFEINAAINTGTTITIVLPLTENKHG
jgi:two-component system sensor histidine kinase HydH